MINLLVRYTLQRNILGTVVSVWRNTIDFRLIVKLYFAIYPRYHARVAALELNNRHLGQKNIYSFDIMIGTHVIIRTTGHSSDGSHSYRDKATTLLRTPISRRAYSFLAGWRSQIKAVVGDPALHVGKGHNHRNWIDKLSGADFPITIIHSNVHTGALVTR